MLGYKLEFKNEFDLAFLKEIVLKKQGGTYSRLTLPPHTKKISQKMIKTDFIMKNNRR